MATQLKPVEKPAADVGAVYGIVAAIQGELAKTGIAKNRQNTGQGYAFRGIDDVYAALSPLLSTHGLCVFPRMISRERVERVTIKPGWKPNDPPKESVTFYVTVEAEFDFVAACDGSRHTVRTFGEAMDSADKATNKAMSAAYKYAAFMTFAIPTEGDNDADATTHEVVAPKRETARDRAAREADANGGTHPNNMPDADDFDAAATALRIGGLLKTASTKAEIGQIWNTDSRADRARLKAADPALYASLAAQLEFETQRVAPAKPSPQHDEVLDDDVPY